MENFDGFVGVDWSGAKSPVLTKSIAVAIAMRGNTPVQLPKQSWSRAKVFDWLQEEAAKKKRLLVGIDCNFGYSEMIGERQFGKNYTAQDLWRAVEDANKDEPNFFAGGYWSHATHEKYFWQAGKMPQGFLMPQRLTEDVCTKSGLGRPESPFKLIGPKQVGKGGLAGMRLVLALKDALGTRVAIWPFERDTGKATLVITEIYPRLFLRMAGHGNAKIRSRADLNQALGALGCAKMTGNQPFSDHQADAVMSAAALRMLCGNATTIPDNLAHPLAPDRLLAREGWIFGSGG